MPFHQHTLSNGLQIIAETSPSALCTSLAFWVKTGSRDETPEVSGVSHYLEHMVFKGTARRDSFAVNRDFSRIGAENNAFTSEENTVFHATFLPEYLSEAVDVLADIMRPALRSEDFDTEKQVILDEIVRYEVQPHWNTYDNARKLYFAGHPLGNSILGSTEGIKALTREQMARYFQDRYVAPNIFVVAAGSLDFSRLVQLIEQACAGWPSVPAPRLNRTAPKGKGGLHLLHRSPDKVSQQYVMLMMPGPSADSPERYSAALLTTVLADATGSRLFWELIDPGLAEDVSMWTDECDQAGTYFISITSAPENAEKCYQITRRVLEQVQSANITSDELELARTKLVSREVRSAERTPRRMLTIGKEWAYLQQYRSLDDELAAWDAVSVRSIREVLDRYPLTSPTTVTLGPLEHFGDGAVHV